MYNIFTEILDFMLKKDRAVIKECETIKIKPYDKTRRMAVDFINSLEGEMRIIRNINELLTCPVVEWDRNLHLKVSLKPAQWLSGYGSLVILFSHNTGRPICAYFKSEPPKGDSDE